MKIYECYSLAEKIFRGKGFWSVLTPVRAVLAGYYYLVMILSGRDQGKIPRHSGRYGGPHFPSGCRVISIGNIVVGGGGKTPCALELARLEKESGGNPVVVTRGYGGKAERSGIPVILGLKDGPAADGTYMTEKDYLTGGKDWSARDYAHAFGDEVSIYRQREILVVIDRDRSRGVELAAGKLDPTVIILDDAYQNNSVKKDLDVLLLDHSKPFADGKVLPLGKLREPPSAARRADAVIFTRAGGGRGIPEEAERFTRGKTVLFSEHKLDQIYGRGGKITAPEKLAGGRMVLYSAIGNPASFEKLVRANVNEPFCSFRFSDHHHYDSRDIDGMMEIAGKNAVFLTTEKDWFKTYQLFPSGVEVFALRMRMVIEGVEDLIGQGRL